MTTQEALNKIKQAKGESAPADNTNYTGNGAMEYYTGNGAFEYMTGQANPSLEFNGGPGASLLDTGDGAEPFVLEIVNSHLTAARSFYLSQGLLYTRGAETAGQLKTGNFQAINDTGTVASLTASTSNSISIEQFIAFCIQNPTYLPLIQVTSSSATAQLSQSLQYYRQGMIKNDIPVTVPFRKYASGEQYNLQFQDIREPLYITQNTIIIVSVAAASTFTMNLYPLVSKSNSSQLRGDISVAKRLLAGDPTTVMKLDNAQKVAIEAVTSQVRNLNSYR